MKDKNTMPSMTLLTMGCRVNQFETDTILKMGKERGLRVASTLEEADVIVVNTCSVTLESERQARKLIRRLGRDYPLARVVVTGCYAERSPESFSQYPQVDLVVGNGVKHQLWDRWLASHPEAGNRSHREDRVVQDSSDSHSSPSKSSKFSSKFRARASLHIQNGCDRSCTYCLIPQVRGPSVSLSVAEVLDQAESLLQSGSRELVLLGIDVGSYGRDLSPPTSLAALMRELVALVRGRGRLRLSSVDPMDIDDSLIRLFHPGSPLCPHLHLSIQSGDDLIRKRMGRQGGRRDLLERIQHLRRVHPHVVLGADLIAGFPTESAEAFAGTLSLVEQAELSLLHVFPFSPRPGTAAARYPEQFHLPDSVIRERARLLREAGWCQFASLTQERLLRPADVLIEKVDLSWAEGTTEDYLTVRFPNQCNDAHGAIRRVNLVGYDPIEKFFSGIIPQLSTELSTGSVDNL